jgi:hypothetical protein
MGPRDVAVRSEGDLHSRRIELGEVPRLNTERLLRRGLVRRSRLKFFQLVGWNRIAEPAEIDRDASSG